MPVQAPSSTKEDIGIMPYPKATVASDFTCIVGNKYIAICDSQPVWKGRFSTPGHIDKTQDAVLIFSVAHLTSTKKPVDIKINQKVAGQIHPYQKPLEPEKGDRLQWFTQMIAFPGSFLTGINEIEIVAVDFPAANPSNQYDDFYIKDMVCFFHKQVT